MDDEWGNPPSRGGVGSWVQPTVTGALPPARHIAGLCVYEGYVYLHGGQGSSVSSARSDFWRYNIITGTWVQLPNSPMAMTGTHLYVYGDAIYSHNGDRFFRYRTEDGWVALTRWATGAINVNGVQVGDTIYVGGGWRSANNTYSQWFAKYNLTTNVWTTLTRMPAVRNNHKMTYHNGYVYAFGGSSANVAGQGTNTLWRYNIANDTWVTLTPPSPTPSARDLHGFWTVEDQLLLFGGRDNAGNKLDDMWCYYPQTNRWENITPEVRPEARWGISGGTMSVPYLFGGTAAALRQDLWKYV